MSRTILWITTAALLSLGACNKKSENPPPSPGSSAPAAGSAAAAGSATAPAAGSGSAAAPSAGSGSAAAPSAGSGSAAAAAVDVPTEQDFEDKAKEKITEKNVDSEVQALEKQLGTK